MTEGNTITVNVEGEALDALLDLASNAEDENVRLGAAATLLHYERPTATEEEAA